MFYSDTHSAPLWAKLSTEPIFNHWSSGLLPEGHRQDIIRASLDDYHEAVGHLLPPVNAEKSYGGLILPESDFESLVSGNLTIKQRGPMFKKTLWALYRDMLDRDATHLFWRMFYCHRKAPVLIDEKAEMVRQPYCHSMFCPTCRGRRQTERAKKALSLFGDRPHDRLHAVTILYNCPTDLDNIKSMTKDFKKEIRHAFRMAEHISQIRCHGAFELDYKRPDLFEVATLDGGTSHRAHCAQAFASMGIDLDSTQCPDSWWLLHYHGIIDVGDNDAGTVKKVFHDAFRGAHRVRMTALHSEDKTPKLESIEKLSSYQIKSKLQYAENIYSDDPSHQNKTHYGQEYEPEIIALLCKTYDENKNISLIKFDYGSRS